MKTQQIPSRILFKRLLNKIRSQKSLWTIRSVSEDGSELTASSSETESRTATMESGAAALEERTLSSEQEQGAFSSSLSDGTQTLFRLFKKKMFTPELDFSTIVEIESPGFKPVSVVVVSCMRKQRIEVKS